MIYKNLTYITAEVLLIIKKSKNFEGLPIFLMDSQLSLWMNIKYFNMRVVINLTW